MARRVTNAQVATLLTQVEAAIGTIPAGQAEVLQAIQATQQADHDSITTLVTQMIFITAAAKRWDKNHTVVSNLKQRQTLIMGVGGTVTLGVIAEAVRRLINHFF